MYSVGRMGAYTNHIHKHYNLTDQVHKQINALEYDKHTLGEINMVA